MPTTTDDTVQDLLDGMTAEDLQKILTAFLIENDVVTVLDEDTLKVEFVEDPSLQIELDRELGLIRLTACLLFRPDTAEIERFTLANNCNKVSTTTKFFIDSLSSEDSEHDHELLIIEKHIEFIDGFNADAFTLGVEVFMDENFELIADMDVDELLALQ